MVSVLIQIAELVFLAAIHCCAVVFRLLPGAGIWSSLGPHGYGEREHKCTGQVQWFLGAGECGVGVRGGRETERERERYLCSPGIIFGRSKSFFKRTNQLPKLSWASDGSTS